MEQLSVGSSARYTHPWDVYEQQFSRFIPPYPGATILKPFALPAPPLLEPSPDAVRKLSVCVVTAMQSRYGKSWLGINRHTEHTLQGALQQCVELLYSLSIAPAAWVLFSIDHWRNYASNKTTPSVKWLCSAKRINERVEWFKFSASVYSGGQLWVAPAHTQLVKQWYKMQRALLSAEPVAERVIQIVEQHLPDDFYKQLIHTARAEYLQTKQRVRMCLSTYECIW